MGFKILALSLLLFTAPSHAGGDYPFARSVLIQLAVSDLDRSIEFYTETLGFELVERSDELQWAKLQFGIEGLRIGIGVQKQAKGSASVSINLGVDDMVIARATLEARGVVFDGPTMIVPGVVQLAEFRDPDGNRLRLAASDPPQP